MRLDAIDTLPFLATPIRSPASIPHTSLSRPADKGRESRSRTGERPDPAFWTPYDYYMIEREARAMRRAHVYAMIAALAKRLRERVFNAKPAQA